MSPISSINHSSTMFSYSGWNLENSESLSQKLCMKSTIEKFINYSIHVVLPGIFIMMLPMMMFPVVSLYVLPIVEIPA